MSHNHQWPGQCTIISTERLPCTWFWAQNDIYRMAYIVIRWCETEYCAKCPNTPFSAHNGSRNWENQTFFHINKNIKRIWLSQGKIHSH